MAERHQNKYVTLIDEYKPAGRYEVEFQSAVGSRPAGQAGWQAEYIFTC